VSEDVRHFRGHGEIYRAGALALRHVGYWLVEQADEGMETMTGFVRGDPLVLRPMAAAGHALVLVLEDGRRLPFRLTNARPDGMTWEIEALGSLR
jgi:hypothetical protein